MPTQLGSGARAQAPSRDDLVFKSDVETLLARGMQQLERRLEQYVNARLKDPPAPVVNVSATPPVVNVAAGAAPVVKVEPYNDVHVEVDLGRLNDNIVSLIKTLNTPVTRIVHRDEAGLITRVEERRG